MGKRGDETDDLLGVDGAPVQIDSQFDGAYRFCKAAERRIEYGPTYVRTARNCPLVIQTGAQTSIERQHWLGVSHWRGTIIAVIALQRRHHRDTRRLQRALDLFLGVEGTVHQLPE